MIIMNVFKFIRVKLGRSKFQSAIFSVLLVVSFTVLLNAGTIHNFSFKVDPLNSTTKYIVGHNKTITETSWGDTVLLANTSLTDSTTTNIKYGSTTTTSLNAQDGGVGQQPTTTVSGTSNSGTSNSNSSVSGTSSSGSIGSNTSAPASGPQPTTLPQSSINLIALQIYTDNENLIKTSEAFDQEKIKLALEQYVIDLRNQELNKIATTVNNAKSNLRQAAIQGAIVEISGDSSQIAAINGISSLNSEVKTQFSYLVVQNLFNKMKDYENVLKNENSQLLKLNTLKTMDSLTLLQLSQDQSQAIAQVSKDQALLDSAGSSLSAILTLVQQYQFGNLQTPQQAQQIAALEKSISAQTAPPAGATPNELAVYYAEQKLGIPYVWGGAGPDGYDCSGLTMVSWGQAGVSLVHSAAIQYQQTDHVPLWDLQPGDLLFYDFSGTNNPADIDHVVMYIGNGLVIQAAYTGTLVMISPIWTNDLVGAGRPVYPNMPTPPSVNAPPPPNTVLPSFVSGS